MTTRGEPIPIIRMLHTIHMVRDVARARKLYQDVFGALAFAERYHEGEDRDMALLYAGDHMVEPMAPRRPETPDTTTSRYLERFGESLHSFELRIADAVSAAERCRESGLRLNTVYPTFFFLHPEATGGVVVELCGKPLQNDPFDYAGWKPDWFLGNPASITGLDHIACVVRDMAVALRFFTEIVAGLLIEDGLRDLPQPARRARIRLGDHEIVLWQPDDATAGPLGDYLAGPVSGIHSLVWRVSDLGRANAHFRSCGIGATAPVFHPEGAALDRRDMLGARHEFIAR